MADLTPFLLPAAISAIVAVIVAYYASRGAENRLKEKYERELSPQKLARQVLLAKRARSLPFSTLQAHFGGLDDNQLRRALLAAGALRFKAEDGTEEWGLISRNKARLAKPEALLSAAPAAISVEPSAANAAESKEEGPSDDWFSDEADLADKVEEASKPVIVKREAPKLARKSKGLASRGRDIGVNLRRPQPVEKPAKGDNLIGELEN